MVEVSCPLGDCDYTGPVKSVEAHISGSTEDDHEGEVGRRHREGLVEQAEGSATSDAGSSDDLPEPVGETTEPATSEEGSPKGGPAVASPALLAPIVGGAALTDGSGGWDRSTLLTVGVLVALLVLLAIASGDGSDSSSASTSTELDDSAEADEEIAGGLV
jgi:hypothetical protein